MSAMQAEIAVARKLAARCRKAEDRVGSLTATLSEYKDMRVSVCVLLCCFIVCCCNVPHFACADACQSALNVWVFVCAQTELQRLKQQMQDDAVRLERSQAENQALREQQAVAATGASAKVSVGAVEAGVDEEDDEDDAGGSPQHEQSLLDVIVGLRAVSAIGGCFALVFPRPSSREETNFMRLTGACGGDRAQRRTGAMGYRHRGRPITAAI